MTDTDLDALIERLCELAASTSYSFTGVRELAGDAAAVLVQLRDS